MPKMTKIKTGADDKKILGILDHFRQFSSFAN
jgi:hypothetical protein